MNTVVDRSRLLAPSGRSSSLPVALFVMNARPPAQADLSTNETGLGRELFEVFRQNAGTADTGAATVV